MAERTTKRQTKDGAVHVNQTVSPYAVKPRRDRVPITPLQGFIDFVREQGVVGLGVAFVVGMAANTLIKSVVTNILNPVIGLVTGGINLNQKAVCLKTVGHVCKNAINYGQVISDFISFLAIVAMIYLVVKSMHLERLDKLKDS